MPANNKGTKNVLLGAAFLMATSAIGPGFLNNTSLFTQQLLTSFGFVILVSILLDIGAQLNIWRILCASEKKAQDMANILQPGLGYILASLVAFGGLAFNIGNMAGCGLGLEVLTGMDPRVGAAISVVISLVLFWVKEAGRAIDWFVKILGIAMIALTAYVMIASRPPFLKAIEHSFFPQQIDVMMIVALVGGTVGGYISFAGIHRLMDSNIKGISAIPQVNRSAVTGILITSVMRYVLFLAVLGVVWSGARLDENNPAASAFSQAAGNGGYYFFGIVLWSAAITSVIGASYTSVSFWESLHPYIQKHRREFTTAFIVLSATLFIWLNKPPSLILVLAGVLNGLILPFGLAIILIAATRKKIMGQYRHPLWLQLTGYIVVLLMLWMSGIAIIEAIDKLR
ncbi:MAG: divalent metal cation transporter [Chitinophagaceae bacterium]|nr:divalent metal cation transporter [Chitinophagaceae bacterium]MCW5929321.1 divalent metal cation transporter [Chitinophagaceae bacterium]